MTLADRLKLARTSAGHDNASEFARVLQVTPNSVYRYERGDQTPGVDVCKRWAAATSVTLDWLLAGKGTGPGDLAADEAVA